MGSGASIDIDVNNDYLHDQYIHKLLASKEERELLFTAISEYKVTLKGKVGLMNLVDYFKDPKNALYPGFTVNVNVLSESLKYVLKERKKHGGKRLKRARRASNTMASVNDHMDISEFHAFFPVLLMFTKLWRIFEAVDHEIINDERVFKSEFMKVRTHLNDFDFKILGEITEQQWEAEFDLINRNNDQYIDFHEFCLFGLKYIRNAFDYDAYMGNNPSDDLLEADEKLTEDLVYDEVEDGLMKLDCYVCSTTPFTEVIYTHLVAIDLWEACSRVHTQSHQHIICVDAHMNDFKMTIPSI
jgi:hypothetical protein